MAGCNIILKANNGNDSNIFTYLYSKNIPRQEAINLYRKIHSYEFTNWFGDWELLSKVKNNIPLSTIEEEDFIIKYNEDINKLESTVGELDDNGEPKIIDSEYKKGEETRNVFSPIQEKDSVASSTLLKEQVEDIASKLANKFEGFSYRIENKPTENWKGKFDNGTAVLNSARFTLDTPFHEFSHLFLEVIKDQNTELYKGLKDEILSTEIGKVTLQTVEQDELYKDSTESDIIDEAIVQLLGEYSAENYTISQTENKNLRYYLKLFLDRMSEYFKKTLMTKSKVYTNEIEPTTTIKELAPYLNIDNKIDTRVNNKLSTKDNGTYRYGQRKDTYERAKNYYISLYGEENIIDYPYTSSNEYKFAVNVPSKVAYSPSKTFFQSDNSIKDTKILNQLESVVEKEKIALQSRKVQLEQQITQGTDNQATENAIKQIDELFIKIEGLDAKEQFLEIVKNGVKQLNAIERFLNNDVYFETPNNLTDKRLAYISKYLPTYKMLDKANFAQGDRKLLGLINKINKLINNIDLKLPERQNQAFASRILKETSKESFLQDPESVIKYLEESSDISNTRAMVTAMADSRDTVLEVLDKLYKRTVLKIQEATRIFKPTLNKVHDNLLKASKGKSEGLFDFMLNKNKGTIVGKISESLQEKINNLNRDLYDENGSKKEFKLISPENLINASKEDINYNKELANIKSNIAKFKANEKVDKGNIIDGDNYKYTEDFKKERRKYEKYDLNTFSWVKKDGITDQQYREYLAKYYGELHSYYTPIREKGKLTGAVELVEKRFVKNEFTEPTDKWTDTKWKSIQLIGVENPTELQKAQKDYYNFYTEQFDNMLSNLPKTISQSMKGRMITMSKHLLENYNASENKMKFISNYFRHKYLAPEAYLNNRRLDEANFEINDIPTFFTQNLKDTAKIEELEKAIADEQDTTQRKELKKQLTIEQNKLKPEEISENLSDSLLAFHNMTENYRMKKGIEGTVLLAQDIVKNKKYFKKNPDGTLAKDAQGKLIYTEGSQSNTYKRLTDWMVNIFYDANEKDKIPEAEAAKKVMRLASIRGLGLNIFSGINNALIGQIFQHIEAIGEQYYSNKSRKRANKYFMKYMSGDVWTDLKNKFNGSEYLSDGEPTTKMANMLNKLPFLQDQSEQYSKGMAGKGFSQKLMDGDWVFVLTHIGEFANQSRVGLSVLMDTMIKDKNGNEVSIWDAHDDKFNLKEGFEWSNTNKENIILKIEEINKLIHGRYTKEDESALQGYWLGKAAFHFRKWIPSFIQTRFTKRYTNELIGIDIEGRYRTLGGFLKSLYDFRGNISQSWNTLDSTGKANMKKNALELAYFTSAIVMLQVIAGIAEDIDDDDEMLNKLVNFLHYQDTRIITEISAALNPLEAYQMVKNPVAATSYIKEIGDVVVEMTALPYNYMIGNYEDSYYSRGIRKGDLKLSKELGDAFPFLTVWNRWINLEKKQDFYIK